MGIRQRWHGILEHLRFRYAPPVVDWLVGASAHAARSRLKRQPITILIDNSVIGHSVTHETTWIDTGTVKWGGQIDVPTGYTARIRVYDENHDSREYRNICFLPGVARLARDGLIDLRTSAELGDERFRQPGGRYRGYGSYDYSLLRGLPLESIDGFVFPDIGPDWMSLPSAREQQQARIAAEADDLYGALLARLGPKNNLDAWHIRTAEQHGAYCFLTMDFRLVKAVRGQQHLEPFRSLCTKVMTPEEFGQEFGLRPIPPVLFSYHDASYPVRADLHRADNRRLPLKYYRRPNAGTPGDEQAG